MAFSVNLSTYAAMGGAPLTYSSAVTYVNGDVVISGGIKYKCKATSTNNTPATGANTYWVEIVEKTIGGATRDYTTLAAWANATPSLTTTNQIWKGILYKEGNGATEWPGVDIGGKSGFVDADRFLWLEPAPGQGFLDNANVKTNALRYNNANGVAMNGGSGTVWGGDRAGPCFIRGIQLSGRVSTSYTTTQLNIANCIINWAGTGQFEYGIYRCVNTVFISPFTSGVFIQQRGGGVNHFTNCTFIGNGGTSTALVAGYANDLLIRNCAFFGFNANVSNSAHVATGSNNNATNLASMGWTGTSNLVSLTASNQFVSASSPYDLRLLSTSALIGAAARLQTETNDLGIGNTIRSTTSPAIGAWESIVLALTTSIGNSSQNVTVNAVSAYTLAGYTNAYQVTLSAAPTSAAKVGDKFTSNSASFLITSISGAVLLVAGNPPFGNTGTAPITGTATISRAYSGIQAWEDACPSNLVTGDQVWKGLLYKEGSGTNNEWQLTSQITVSGITADATHYLWLTAADTQSYKDNASKTTNALRYNSANGVAISTTPAYVGGIVVNGGSSLTLTGLQWKINHPEGYGVTSVADANSLLSIDSCILQNNSNNAYGGGVCATADFGGKLYIVNSVLVCAVREVVRLISGSSQQILNCTLYTPFTAAIYAAYSATTRVIKNCAVFSSQDFQYGTGTFTTGIGYNATNASSAPGSNNVLNLVTADQFESVTANSWDFRIKETSGLINAGTADVTNTSGKDSIGKTRGTTPTIGAWEYTLVSILASIGNNSQTVTISSVTSSVRSGFTNVYSVVLSNAPTSSARVGDKLISGANSYLILSLNGTTLLVAGNPPFNTSSAAPTTGTATISRAYSSAQTWEDSIPANLVILDQMWTAEIYKEGSGTNNEWVTSNTTWLNANGHTTDSSHYLWIRAGTDQSFRDSLTKTVNDLRYNPANGVAVSPGTSNLVDNQANTKVRLTGVQLKCDNAFAFNNYNNPQPTTLENCIYQGGSKAFNGSVLATNSLIYLTSGYIGNPNTMGSAVFTNCTIVGHGGSIMFSREGRAYGGGILFKNCAIYNFTDWIESGYITLLSSRASWVKTYTSISTLAGGTGLANSVYANQFLNTATNTWDFRVKGGSDLILNGSTEALTKDLDIIDQKRNLTKPTVGAWEYLATTGNMFLMFER